MRYYLDIIVKQYFIFFVDANSCLKQVICVLSNDRHDI
jgi:hypothetical protein